MSFRYRRHAMAVMAIVAIAACSGRDQAGSGGDTSGVGSVVDRLTGDSARSSTTAELSGADSSSDSAKAANALASGTPPMAYDGSPRPLRTVRIGELDLTGVGYDIGEPTAPVVLVNFSDFGCPYCRQFTKETYPVIAREYVRTGKVFFKYVPFISGVFPNVQQATRSAECAADQGAFWAMHDSLYAEQDKWKDALVPSRIFVPFLAGSAVDRPEYGSCYTRQALHPRTTRANQIANQLQIRVTPTFAVNQRMVEGALPLADLRKVIDDELSKATATK